MEKGSSESTRLLNLEKRIVDAELVVAQFNDKLKSIDFSMLSELKQKEEDLEDLVLVNNAGITELKKILESTTQPVIPDDLKNKLDQMSSEVEALKQNKPDQLEDVKQYVDKKLSEIPQPLTDKVMQPVLEEFQNLRGDFMMMKSKLASTEKYTQDIGTELQTLRPSIDRLEKIANFEPTIGEAETKMQQMAGLISKANEALTMLSASDVVTKSQLSDAVGRINHEMNNMGRRLEGNRLFLMETFKEDLKRATSHLDQSNIYSNVNKMVEEKLQKFETALNEKLKETVKSFEETVTGPSILDEQMIELVNRTLYLETRLSSLEKTIKEIQHTTMPIIIE